MAKGVPTDPALKTEIFQQNQRHLETKNDEFLVSHASYQPEFP